MRNEGRPLDAAAAVCHSTDWRVLVLVPTRTLLASTFSLYFQILGVVALCLVVFAVLIWHFYRRFMAPLAQLEQAMRQADAGDLKAYVKPQDSVEVVRMMEGYNAMLDSLRTGIEQQMEMQRRRQDLEMQVLMSQTRVHRLEGRRGGPPRHRQAGLVAGQAVPAEHFGRAVRPPGAGAGTRADVHEHPAQPLRQQGGL